MIKMSKNTCGHKLLLTLLCSITFNCLHTLEAAATTMPTITSSDAVEAEVAGIEDELADDESPASGRAPSENNPEEANVESSYQNSKDGKTEFKEYLNILSAEEIFALMRAKKDPAKLKDKTIGSPTNNDYGNYTYNNPYNPYDQRKIDDNPPIAKIGPKGVKKTDLRNLFSKSRLNHDAEENAKRLLKAANPTGYEAEAEFNSVKLMEIYHGALRN
jgi:hypothetical protein